MTNITTKRLGVKLSIIVPVYKVEKYLIQCVESILQSIVDDTEIILIDDGSPDNCPQICDDFARNNRDIVRVIHKDNGGLMSAWKAGVRMAKGEYLGFVDSDDWIDSNMFKMMLDVAETYRVDMVSCGYIAEYGNDKRMESKTLPPDGLYSDKMIEERLFPILINDGSFSGRNILPSRVTKLFKKDLLMDNLHYCREDISLGEDLIITFACICDTKSIYLMNNEFKPYHHRINNQSITGSYNPRFFFDAKKLIEQVTKISNEKNRYDFNFQIVNDFVCLSIAALENEMYLSPSRNSKNILKTVRDICLDNDLQSALKVCFMNKLGIRETIYIFLMKRKCVRGIYLFRKIIDMIKITRS